MFVHHQFTYYLFYIVKGIFLPKKLRVRGKILTKRDFVSGRHIEMIRKSGLEQYAQLNTDDYKVRQKDELIKKSPGKMIWIFGYGSLLWNPAFDYEKQDIGILYGYHRRFCFWSKIGRGTPKKPGMMLGLDRGGSCRGILLGVSRGRANEELNSVFMRELTGVTYHSKLLRVLTKEGPVMAITFVSNPLSPHYVEKLNLEDTARYIAQGKGHLGPCYHYLFNTVEHLEALGIHDPVLNKLRSLVRSIRK